MARAILFCVSVPNGVQGEAGSRLVVRNFNQWTGDFSRTDAIGAFVRNFGSTTLTMRIAIDGPGGWFASTNAAAHTLIPGTDWTWVVFSLDPADLTNTFGQGGNNVAATLADVTELRILNSAAPNFRADTSIANAGVDNITALVDSTITSGDGNYSFGVLPGSYTVQFTLPAGRLFSPQDQGNDDVDSDADPATGSVGPIVVNSGDDNDTVDAGMFTPQLTVSIVAASISEGDGPRRHHGYCDSQHRHDESADRATGQQRYDGSHRAGVDYHPRRSVHLLAV